MYKKSVATRKAHSLKPTLGSDFYSIRGGVVPAITSKKALTAAALATTAGVVGVGLVKLTQHQKQKQQEPDDLVAPVTETVQKKRAKDAIKYLYIEALTTGFCSLVPVLVRLNKLNDNDRVFYGDRIFEYIDTFLWLYFTHDSNVNTFGNEVVSLHQSTLETRLRDTDEPVCDQIKALGLYELQHLAQLCKTRPPLSQNLKEAFSHELLFWQFREVPPQFKNALLATQVDVKTSKDMAKLYMLPYIANFWSNCPAQNSNMGFTPFENELTQRIDSSNTLNDMYNVYVKFREYVFWCNCVFNTDITDCSVAQLQAKLSAKDITTLNNIKAMIVSNPLIFSETYDL